MIDSPHQHRPNSSLLFNWIQTSIWVHAPLGISEQNTCTLLVSQVHALSWAKEKILIIVHSPVLKDNWIPLIPNFPNHNNPHTPPIPVCLLRHPSQIELSEMGSGIPMVDYIKPNPLATQTPDPPCYRTFEKDMTPRLLFFLSQNTQVTFHKNPSSFQIRMCR